VTDIYARILTVFAFCLIETLKLLQRLLKSPGCRKIPVLVQNKDDVIVAASNFSSERC